MQTKGENFMNEKPSFWAHVIAGAGWAVGAALAGWGMVSLAKAVRAVTEDEDDEESENG